MALLMVHLLVAQRWAQSHAEYRDCPDFYLGAISPDAVYIRDGKDKSHKDEIHLNNWLAPHPEPVIDYWRSHSTPFDVGYGIHVLTDAQWAPRFRAAFPEILYPDGRVRTEIYYGDTFSTDYALYRECGGEALFGLVDRGRAPEGHPMLSQHAFDAWRRMMVEEYKNQRRPEEPVRIITRAFVEQFIGDSQQLLNETYGRYEHE